MTLDRFAASGARQFFGKLGLPVQGRDRFVNVAVDEDHFLTHFFAEPPMKPSTEPFCIGLPGAVLPPDSAHFRHSVLTVVGGSM
ncbi:MAG: hypothetical protein WAM17_17745 [Rhodoplanes sp.]